MYLQKRDVEKILKVMEDFPDADSFELKETGNSGIGTIITLTAHTTINGYDGEFTTEISGAENW